MSKLVSWPPGALNLHLTKRDKPELLCNLGSGFGVEHPGTEDAGSRGMLEYVVVTRGPRDGQDKFGWCSC